MELVILGVPAVAAFLGWQLDRPRYYRSEWPKIVAVGAVFGLACFLAALAAANWLVGSELWYLAFAAPLASGPIAYRIARGRHSPRADNGSRQRSWGRSPDAQGCRRSEDRSVRNSRRPSEPPREAGRSQSAPFKVPDHWAIIPADHSGNWVRALCSCNTSCPCGSGKKYKHCHGEFTKSEAELRTMCPSSV